MMHYQTVQLGFKTFTGTLVIVGLSSASTQSLPNFQHLDNFQYLDHHKNELGEGPPYSGDQVGTGTHNEDWGDSYSGRQTGTGVRNDCPATPYPLVALMPDSNWSQTSQERPTFWFYVPYTTEQNASARFSIEYWDEDAETEELSEENYRYNEFSVDLTDQAGFVSITIPDEIDPLDTGVDYEWTFKIFCGQQSITPVFVSGWVQFNDSHVNLPSNYESYLGARIWLDAINSLGQQRLQQPEDPALIQEWQMLLQSGGLGPELLPVEPILGELAISKQ